MKVISARNVHQAFPIALGILLRHGVKRDSRNSSMLGPVLQFPTPVTTVYQNPRERVLFWPQRDANPFLHLYESLWMLVGRNDLAPLVRYAKQFESFSDDGKTLHGAYGYRWRTHFGVNQLGVVIDKLRNDPDDRRCVVSMWDAEQDLYLDSKDIPCNLTITFQMSVTGVLDMVVFCRSNDIVWGCYGANAVHFSFLQEYIALGIGCPMGTYTQVSVNWHGYEKTLAPLCGLEGETTKGLYSVPTPIDDPYVRRLAEPTPLGDIMWRQRVRPERRAAHLHEELSWLLCEADEGFPNQERPQFMSKFTQLCHGMLMAHAAWKNMGKATGIAMLRAMKEYQKNDWVVAGIEWLERRQR